MKPDSILYYPHIEFQNVAWVKSSLLLWNHVYRIVPEGYVPNDNDDIKALENLVNSKDAVLCKIQRIIPQLDLTTISEGEKLASIDDILNRDPMDTLREAFAIKHNVEMNEQQEALLDDLLNGIKNETVD